LQIRFEITFTRLTIKDPLFRRVAWCSATCTKSKRTVLLLDKRASLWALQCDSFNKWTTLVTVVTSLQAEIMFGTSDKYSSCQQDDDVHMYALNADHVMEIFTLEGKLLQEHFYPNNKWLKNPLPPVNSSSVVRSCVAEGGIIHFFYFDDNSNLINVYWDSSIYRWDFKRVSSAITLPKFLLKGRQWTSISCRPAWEFSSLACTRRGSEIVVFCNCSYKMLLALNLFINSMVVFTLSDGSE
jgi:hypothetical protein